MTSTIHVCVLGIDGSGKSTLAAALPVALAAEHEIVAGSAGEHFRVAAPDEDLLAPGFAPDGLPLSARLATWLKRRAKALADDRRRYPRYKLAQMLFQDAAARTLARRYRTDVFVSDGNTLLSATGRAANYRRPASEDEDGARPAPDVEDLAAVFRHLLKDEPLPQESLPRLPRLDASRTIKRLLKLARLDSVWLPDIVVFLDLSPEGAIERIDRRGARVDRHENERDLRQAREMYGKTLEAYARHGGPAQVIRIPVDDLGEGEVLERALAALRERLSQRSGPGAGAAPLGTTSEDLSARGLLGKVLNARYVFRYLVAKWFEGAWREPLFVFSEPGRRFLGEGYSAGIMRAIYDANGRLSTAERVFFGYPLHRAVSDRLRILVGNVERELEDRLDRGETVSVLTAPSGFAYDLFEPLESIARRKPEAVKRVRLLAADLDPHETLAEELSGRAERLGVEFELLRGDLTSETMRERIRERGPFDVVLFVGLSSWIPKPALVHHLRFVRDRLRPAGVLVTDAFTAGAYALSGKYVGFRAHYYEPGVYRTLVSHCGFDGSTATLESGRDRLNHVMLFRPRA